MENNVNNFLEFRINNAWNEWNYFQNFLRILLNTSQFYSRNLLKFSVRFKFFSFNDEIDLFMIGLKFHLIFIRSFFARFPELMIKNETTEINFHNSSKFCDLLNTDLISIAKIREG